MSRVRYASLAITVNGSGDATVYFPRPVAGELLAIRLTIGTWTGGAADVTITDNDSGMALLTVANLAASADYFPRANAVLPGTPGTPITNSFVPIPLGGTVKVVVAQAGNATTGTVHIWWRD